MLRRGILVACSVVCLYTGAVVKAGPYTEAAVCGYIGADWRSASPSDSDAVINPIFRGWATDFRDYLPSDDEWYGPGVWNDPNKALGPAEGDLTDIVSLGDLDQAELDNNLPPGEITLLFGDPCDPNDPNHIRNVNGYDFVVFENGCISDYNTSGGSVSGQMFAELGYVEVSSDGTNFVRFPPVSLTSGLAGVFGTIEISDIFNLAGKHPNAYGLCTGTPFDLSDIADDPNVLSGAVDINKISCVRIVDIPGSGDFLDEAGRNVAPNTWPLWTNYDSNQPIYDAWLTEGSGGLDLEAIGILNEQEYCADINLDGVVDLFDLDLFSSAWLSHFGEDSWIARCDLAKPKNLVIDFSDFAVFASQWDKMENWRSQ